jgi:hypothetical protein
MNRELQQGTAMLAALFGASLMKAESARDMGTFDAHQARELSVLARILEKRLGDVRREMAQAA